MKKKITAIIQARMRSTRLPKKVLMNDGKGGHKLYNSKAQYELIITRNSIYTFANNVGFLQNYKNNKMNKIINDMNLTDDLDSYQIISITAKRFESTYCLTEPENNEITINGFIIGNCVEIGLNPIDPITGETGWQVCNLTEINGGAIHNKEDFREAVKAATIIGTIQAGYSYFHYLTDISRRIIRRERLLGVSVTGWMENPELLLDPDLQREMGYQSFLQPTQQI